jgi:thiol-disulfide isomerase/thioredoxin
VTLNRPHGVVPAAIAILALVLAGCVGGSSASVPATSSTTAAPTTTQGGSPAGSATTASPASAAATASPTSSAASGAPEWFGIELVDVVTGKVFSINDFAGKVVLVETMAQWCSTCRSQQDQVVRLHGLLGGSSDVVSISIDIDFNEDATTLRQYAAKRAYNWRMAVATKPLARALESLYGAQYLNPPSAPMLFVDRGGAVHALPFGLKSAEDLKAALAPFLGS